MTCYTLVSCDTLNTLVDFISVFKLNSQYDNHQMQQVQLQSEQFNPRRFQLNNSHLCHTRHSEWYTLGCFHIFANRIQRHHLKENWSDVTTVRTVHNKNPTSNESLWTSVTSHQAQAHPPTTVFLLVDPQQPPAKKEILGNYYKSLVIVALRWSECQNSAAGNHQMGRGEYTSPFVVPSFLFV